MVEYTLIFLFTGAIVGTLAGLLGIGGGIVLVPTLSYLFPKIGLPLKVVMQVSLGTSVACTFFSMLSSSFRHFKQGFINFDIFSKIIPGLISGALIGPVIAHNLEYHQLKSIFAILLFFISLKMLFGDIIKKKNSNSQNDNIIYYNNYKFLITIGILIGTISSLIGIGGGIILVPLFSFMNIKMRDAVGTSALCGVCISFIALNGYIVSGYNDINSYELFLGYVYIPAVFAISLTSIIFAQISALWSKKIPQDKLKKILACLLIFTSGKMFW